jgi:glycine hydroxymethyltransferase
MERTLRVADPEVAAILDRELARQRDTLILIPSENYASRAVLAATGSIMTNKYAEGYPGRRYYHGCGFVDEVETLAIARAKQLFGAEHANVQPVAGAQANMSAYYALLKDGDKVMAMRLDQGGHLSHGSPVNFSGHYYQFVSYGVDRETEMLDYDALLAMAEAEKPKLIVAGASAYSRTLDFAQFRAIADAVGALLMVDMAHIAGLVAAGLHPSPVPYADIVTTTTHKTLRGPRSALILCREQYAKAVDKAVFPGIQAGPLMHIVAAKAVAFGEAMQPGFVDYQRQILANAKALERSFLGQGCRIVSGGTDTHLMLLDVKALGLFGKQAANLLYEAGICVNFNTIPFDTEPPARGSGIRPGTPCLTTRGMKEEEMAIVAGWVAEVLQHPEDESIRARVKEEVAQLCRRFPVYEYLHAETRG